MIAEITLNLEVIFVSLFVLAILDKPYCRSYTLKWLILLQIVTCKVEPSYLSF